MLMIFVVYMLLTGFTVLNMLVGILAEVVQATGDHEEAKADLDVLTESLGSIISKLDVDGDRTITKSEFDQMRSHPELQDALKALNVSSEDFAKYGDLIFSTNEGAPAKGGKGQSISYGELANIIYKLRPGVGVSAIDIACFEHGMHGMLNVVKAKFRKLEKISSVVARGSSPESVQMLLRSATFNRASPKSRFVSPQPSGTATPNSMISRSSTEIADITEMHEANTQRGLRHTSRVKVFDEASTAVAGSKANGNGPSTVDDPLWHSLATRDILGEVQRRLTSTDARETSLARRRKDESAAAHEAIATFGVPALPGEIPSPYAEASASVFLRQTPSAA